MRFALGTRLKELPEVLEKGLKLVVALNADFDRLVAPGFWETGATGRRYSRVFARQVLAQRPGRPDPGTWQTDQHHLQRVSEDVWLLTYRLRQPGRVTRRMTLWRREAGRWQAVYHQGTVVAG